MMVAESVLLDLYLAGHNDRHRNLEDDLMSIERECIHLLTQARVG